MTRLLLPILACLCMLVQNRSLAQQETKNVLTGRLVDAESGLPLPSANVYLSYTTIGAVTSPDGKFRITNIPTGVYDLVASLLGYERIVKSVTIAPGDSLFLDLALNASMLRTGEVDVVADQPKEWRENLDRFTKAFIGDTPNAEKCRILNPEVIEFTYDPKAHNLFATSDSIIRIENDALGYAISLVLAKFAWNTEMNVGVYVIYPKFRELPTADAGQRETWEANRQICYEGSLKHFLHAIADGTAKQDEFHCFAEGRRKRISGVDIMVDPEELLAKDTDALPYRWIAFPGSLRVEFRRGIQTKVTILRLKEKAALVDPYGNLVNPLSMEVSGSWAKYRVADLLPMH